jgi:hypothetical protein
MAQENKRLQESSAAGLSAVEQALDLDMFDPPGPAAATAQDPAPGPRMPNVDEPARPERLEEPGDEAVASAPAPAPSTLERPARTVVEPDRAAVANDDRQNIGALLQALQRRPSGRPYVVALVASILWVGGLLYIGYSRLGGEFGPFLASLTPVPAGAWGGVARRAGGPVLRRRDAGGPLAGDAARRPRGGRGRGPAGAARDLSLPTP